MLLRPEGPEGPVGTEGAAMIPPPPPEEEGHQVEVEDQAPVLNCRRVRAWSLIKSSGGVQRDRLEVRRVEY